MKRDIWQQSLTNVTSLVPNLSTLALQNIARSTEGADLPNEIERYANAYGEKTLEKMYLEGAPYKKSTQREYEKQYYPDFYRHIAFATAKVEDQQENAELYNPARLMENSFNKVMPAISYGAQMLGQFASTLNQLAQAKDTQAKQPPVTISSATSGTV